MDNIKKYWGIFLISLLIVCSLDLISKYYVFEYLEPRNIFPFFDIVKVRNYGVSFGMFQNPEYGKFIFPIIALFIIFGLLYFVKDYDNKMAYMACGAISGGAIGNNIDRVVNGGVADFLDFYINNYHWPAFNIADSFICISAIYLFFMQTTNKS